MWKWSSLAATHLGKKTKKTRGGTVRQWLDILRNHNAPDWKYRSRGCFHIAASSTGLFLFTVTTRLEHNTEPDVRSSPAVVGSTVPIAVLAVPLGVLAVHWVRGPRRLWASNTVLVLSLDVRESLPEEEELLVNTFSEIHLPVFLSQICGRNEDFWLKRFKCEHFVYTSFV